MALKTMDQDEILRGVGHDATSTFDGGPSNPTEHAGSESMISAAPDDIEDDDEEDNVDEDEDLADGDDEAAEDEEDDEENEDEDIEDEAELS